MQTLHNHGIFRRHTIAKRLRAVRGWNAGGIEQVLPTPGNAMQWPTIVSGGDLGIGLFRLLERQVARHRDDAVEPRIEPLQSLKINVGQPLRRELAMLDPLRKLRDRGKCDVRVAPGKWTGIHAAANEAVLLRCRFQSRQNRIPARRGGEGCFQGDLARSGTAFVERRHRSAPAFGGHRTLSLGQLHARQLFSLCEGGRRNIWPDPRARSECRRFARGQVAHRLRRTAPGYRCAQ